MERLEALAAKARAEDGPRPALERLDWLEARVVAAGMPPISAWWRATLARWYGSGRRQLVVRAGRRAGKSSTLSRVAVLEALFGDHILRPDDPGVVAIVSTKLPEAAERMRTIRVILDAIGEPYHPGPNGSLELDRRNVRFSAFAATIAGVSGFTCIFALCDEVAKWRDADTGANPATVVLESLRPTLATQRNARLVLSSSPLGLLDAHAAAFGEGETPAQVVAHAPTWEAHPALTEGYTRTLEPREDVWRREYAAEPLEDADSAMLSAALLTKATRAEPLDLPPRAGWQYVAAMDPATRGNGWTLVVATRGQDVLREVLEPGSNEPRRRAVPRRVVVLAREWRGSSVVPLDPDAVFADMARILAPYRVSHVLTDQWSTDALAAVARAHRLTLSQDTVSSGKKLELWEDVGTWLADGQVEIPALPQLRADLLGVRRRVTASGMGVTLAATPDGRHSDYAPAVALALSWALRLPRAAPQGDEERVEADALKRDLWQHGPEAHRREREPDPLAAPKAGQGLKRALEQDRRAREREQFRPAKAGAWWQRDPLGRR